MAEKSLQRWGGIPLWEWGCFVCRNSEGGEARAVVAEAKAHTRETGHSTWLHNILMWNIEPTEPSERGAS